MIVEVGHGTNTSFVVVVHVDGRRSVGHPVTQSSNHQWHSQL